ncbi:hypothetical protein [Devosia soli]|uniref:hypothetical protein n=1 Tax=Devosia soli TaxID=361041 RepID=UPI00128E887E|nr:hypothetical protein [Devosia soli]
MTAYIDLTEITFEELFFLESAIGALGKVETPSVASMVSTISGMLEDLHKSRERAEQAQEHTDASEVVALSVAIENGSALLSSLPKLDARHWAILLQAAAMVRGDHDDVVLRSLRIYEAIAEPFTLAPGERFEDRLARTQAEPDYARYLSLRFLAAATRTELASELSRH